MQKEYRIAKGWGIFALILLSAFMLVFGYLGIMPYTDAQFNMTTSIIISLICVGIEALLVIGLLDARKSKLIVDKERITYIGLFGTRTIRLQDIKGYRMEKHYLMFYPIDKEDKKIKVSQYVGEFYELSSWTKQHFYDLNDLELIEDKQELLNNTDYGWSEEERIAKITKAKRLTKVINATAWMIAASVLVLPQFFQVEVILCALYPILGIFISKTSKGLIKLNEKPNSAHPSLLSTLFVPPCALLLKTLLNYTIFDYSNFGVPAFSLFLTFCFLLIYGSKFQYDFKNYVVYLTMIGIIALGGCYAYGVLMGTDVAFDTSQPQMYKAAVLGKHVNTGKTKTYYLKLSTWGPQKQIEDVSVKSNIYDQKAIGDTAVVYFSTGLLHIPYYMVVR